MTSMMERMMKVGYIKDADVISKSEMFNDKDFILTDLPVLNLALSGYLNAGLKSGSISMVCGDSRTYKTLLCLYMMKAYMEKYDDAIGIIYDNEGGITPDYLKSQGIDTDRVLHIPFGNLEELNFDVTSRLNEIKRGEHVFFMLDSLGMTASIKEIENSENEKTTQDMTRARVISSFFRMVNPHVVRKNLAFVVINHIYMEQGAMYPKAIVKGGSLAYLTPSTIFIITKSQEKDGTELIGYNFTLNIEKSRYIKDKAKLKFTVKFEDGIYRYSSLLEWATEFGFVKQSGAWYTLKDFNTGDFMEKKTTSKNIPDSWYESLLLDTTFNESVTAKYKIIQDSKEETGDEEIPEADLED